MVTRDDAAPHRREGAEGGRRSRGGAAIAGDETAHLKQDRAVRTRGQILQAAAQAFAAHGFPDVILQAIADRAGVTKGAVYFHFANKEALAVAVTKQFYVRLGGVVHSAMTAGDPASPATILNILTTVARAFRDDTLIQAGARLQIERAYIKADLPVPYAEFTTLLTGLLVQCKDAGTISHTSDPAALARVLRSALFGAQHISWIQEDRADVVERVQEIAEAFLPFK